MLVPISGARMHIHMLNHSHFATGFMLVYSSTISGVNTLRNIMTKAITKTARGPTRVYHVNNAKTN